MLCVVIWFNASAEWLVTLLLGWLAGWLARGAHIVMLMAVKARVEAPSKAAPRPMRPARGPPMAHDSTTDTKSPHTPPVYVYNPIPLSPPVRSSKEPSAVCYYTAAESILRSCLATPRTPTRGAPSFAHVWVVWVRNITMHVVCTLSAHLVHAA